jgi:hypothetical protein
MIQLSAMERDYVRYGESRALEAYARHLRGQIKFCRITERTDTLNAKDAAAFRRELQGQLNNFNRWRRQRRKAKR